MVCLVASAASPNPTNDTAFALSSSSTSRPCPRCVFVVAIVILVTVVTAVLVELASIAISTPKSPLEGSGLLSVVRLAYRMNFLPFLTCNKAFVRNRTRATGLDISHFFFAPIPRGISPKVPLRL